jgi:hypothetical protein
MAAGNITWWSELGIHIAVPDKLGGVEVKSMTDNQIKALYDEIPTESRVYAKGIFDSVNLTLRWLYKSPNETSTNLQGYDRMLNYDLRLGAFYPYEFPVDSTLPFIGDFFEVPALNFITNIEDVYVDTDLVQADTDDVITRISTLADITATKTRYLVGVPTSGGEFELTLADLTNTEFLDWYTFDSTGLDAQAFMETGELLEGEAAREKQAPYIHCFFTRTEIGTSLPSSCKMRVKWDFTTGTGSSKWTDAQQVYRFRSNLSEGIGTVVTKNKVRGRGKSIRVQFASDPGKDMILLGWNISYTINTLAV